MLHVALATARIARHVKWYLFACACIGANAASSTIAQAQSCVGGISPCFQGIGFIAGGTHSIAYGVSANGLVVVGSGDSTGGNEQALRWADGAITGLGFLPGGNSSAAVGASADGSVVVGSSNTSTNLDPQAARWTMGSVNGLAFLPGCNSSQATAVSADGSVVVGGSDTGTSCEAQAFRWQNGSMAGLGFLPGGNSSMANGASADGSVVVGSSSSSTSQLLAFRWFNGTMVSLGILPGGSTTAANGVNADGSVVAGAGDFGFNNEAQAVRWVNSTKSGIGFLPNGGRSLAKGVSADGFVVVGFAYDANSNLQAFRWTRGGSMHAVADLLTGAGINVAGWQLNGAAAVSADGRTIVGSGIDPNGRGKAGSRACRYRPMLSARTTSTAMVLATLSGATATATPRSG
jgi:probable HAF family extracellular repeat protein